MMHVEVLEEGLAVCIRKVLRCGDPKVRQEARDVQQDRVASLSIAERSALSQRDTLNRPPFQTHLGHSKGSDLRTLPGLDVLLDVDLLKDCRKLQVSGMGVCGAGTGTHRAVPW